MGKAMALAVVLILLIFMHGCVTEQDITISETEKVLSANADDIDYDGYADIKHYVFRPIVINAQDNLVMQKMVDEYWARHPYFVQGIRSTQEDRE